MRTTACRRWLQPLLAFAVLAASGSARAVDVELGANSARLSAGFATQSAQNLRLGWHGDNDRLLQMSLERHEAFGESASLGIVSIAQDLSPVDRAGLALAASDAATILARTRLDTFYSRKLLAERNLVATLAGYVAHVADGHRDLGLVGSAAWYFADRQVAEAGIRWARSDPGAKRAWRGFVGYTWGAVGQDTVALHLEGGHEAYQSLGANAAVADFRSDEFALAWRHWISHDAGLSLGAARYSNPTYSKRTLTVVGFVTF
jgi:YaiO family outer membrane protein